LKAVPDSLFSPYFEETEGSLLGLKTMTGQSDPVKLLSAQTIRPKIMCQELISEHVIPGTCMGGVGRNLRGRISGIIQASLFDGIFEPSPLNP
jgi:hypothetical protein